MRKVLIDTQLLLWIRGKPEKLTRKAIEAYEDVQNELHLSIASVWEMAIKISLGKLKLDQSLEEFVIGATTKLGFKMISIDIKHLLVVQSLAFHHRDPFDRLLISQALSENMAVIGNDKSWDAYGVKRLW